MIRFYSYYNHGGYKDMYLGSNSENFDSVYYLPLLGVYEDDLQNSYDAEAERYLSRCSSLPKIILLNDSTKPINYPDVAKRMISHGGYKLMCRSANNGETILSLRDISGTKDSFSRPAPFSFLAVADRTSKGELIAIAEHIRSHIQEWDGFITSLFVYDLEVNGLRFDIGKLVCKINSVCEASAEVVDYQYCTREIHFVLIPHRNDLDLCLREQNISRDDINVIYDITGHKMVHETSQDTYGYGDGVSNSEYLYEKLIDWIKQLEKRIEYLEKRMNL